jgi:hypothetical protein
MAENAGEIARAGCPRRSHLMYEQFIRLAPWAVTHPHQSTMKTAPDARNRCVAMPSAPTSNPLQQRFFRIDVNADRVISVWFTVTGAASSFSPFHTMLAAAGGRDGKLSPARRSAPRWGGQHTAGSSRRRAGGCGWQPAAPLAARLTLCGARNRFTPLLARKRPRTSLPDELSSALIALGGRPGHHRQ